MTFNKNELTFLCISRTFTPNCWPQYPSIGATRQQSVYLAGRCNFWAFLSACSEIETGRFLLLLWFLTLSLPFLVVVLLQNRVPLLSPLSTCLWEQLLASTFTNWLNVHLHCFLLTAGVTFMVRLVSQFSHSSHLHVLTSRDLLAFFSVGHRSGMYRPGLNTEPKVSYLSSG